MINLKNQLERKHGKKLIDNISNQRVLNSYQNINKNVNLNDNNSMINQAKMNIRNHKIGPITINLFISFATTVRPDRF